MKITKYICDVCSKGIEEEDIVKIAILDSKGNDLHPDLGEADFCQNCAESVYRFITGAADDTEEKSEVAPVQPNIEPEKKEEEKPKAKRESKPKKQTEKKRIDTGRVIALYNAGWTIKAIAEDTYYPEKTVESIITAAKMRKLVEADAK